MTLQIAHQLALRQFNWVADIVRGTMIGELHQAAAVELQRKRARMNTKTRLRKSR